MKAKYINQKQAIKMLDALAKKAGNGAYSNAYRNAAGLLIGMPLANPEELMEAMGLCFCKGCGYYTVEEDSLPYCTCPDGGISDYPRPYDFCSYAIPNGLKSHACPEDKPHWIVRHTDEGDEYECTECGNTVQSATLACCYCPHCGEALTGGIQKS